MGYEEAMDYLKDQADRLDDEREAVEALTAERDQLRAEVDRLRGLAATNAADATKAMQMYRAATARAEAAEAHVADLRAALEGTDRRLGKHHESSHIQRAAQSLLGEHCPICVEAPQVFIRHAAALARTPAQSLAKVKAEALREFAKSRDVEVVGDGDWYNGIEAERTATIGDLLETAARLEKEAANGR